MLPLLSATPPHTNGILQAQRVYGRTEAVIPTAPQIHCGAAALWLGSAHGRCVA